MLKTVIKLVMMMFVFFYNKSNRKEDENALKLDTLRVMCTEW